MKSKKFQFYGRRKGRKLSNEKQRILTHTGSKFLFSREDIPKKINSLKGRVYLEIGFGSGENLINFSLKHPDYNFIGAEPYVNSYITTLKNIYRYKINNIQIFPDDVRLILNNFKKCLFSGIILLHPDRGQKTKHIKRRIIQQDFISALYKILKKNGIIMISSDHVIMKSWILEQFHIRDDFLWMVNNLNKTYNTPKCIIESKYF